MNDSTAMLGQLEQLFLVCGCWTQMFAWGNYLSTALYGRRLGGDVVSHHLAFIGM